MELPLKPLHRLLGLFLVFLLGSSSQAAPGDVDSLNLNVVGTAVFASAVQPDGKMIIGGSFTTVLGVTRNNIARVNADGTLDAGFNPNANGTVGSVVVQADGKILLGGSFTSVGGFTRNYIAQVAPDGTLDTGFNPDASGQVSSVVLQADGMILLGGHFTSIGGTPRNRIARVDANGTLDASFNPDANSGVYSLAIQTDGKILLGGNFTSIGGTTRNRIARVEVDGTLDAGFNPSASGAVYCLASQADGKILLGGDFTGVGTSARNRLARVAANGTIDTGFDPNANGWIDAMAVQADGKILIGGSFTRVGGTTRNRIARLAADGTLDADFNPDVDLVVNSVAVQADGKILIGGTFDSVSGTGRNRYARLLNAPATQSLSAVDTTQVKWTRGGSAPDIMQTTFELSTDGGSSFTPLAGTATRVDSTPHWKLTGLNLPASGWLRARGRPSNGDDNGNLVEQVISFSGLVAPDFEVTLVTPAKGGTQGGTTVKITGTDFTGATSVTFGGTAAVSFTVDSATQITAITPAHVADSVDVRVTTPEGSGIGSLLYTFLQPPSVTTSTAKLLTVNTSLGITGTGFSTTPGENTVTFKPTGTGVVYSSSGTVLSVIDISGLTPGPLHAVVTTNGVSSVAPVQVATVTLPMPGDEDRLDLSLDRFVNTTAVQSDGKIIIAGSFRYVQTVALNNIARMNADGTLDTEFNPNVNGQVSVVAVQANGQILITGAFTSVGGTARNRIARLNADGTLDLSFNPNPNDRVSSIAVQTDGQILLVGDFTSVGGVLRNRIARVDANGTLDAGFILDANSVIYCVAVQPNGQILIGGQFTSISGTSCNHIARVDADGAVDTSFNPNPNSSVQSVAVQADGKILLGGGFTSVGGITRNRIARVAGHGTLDLSFDPNVNSEINSYAEVKSVAVQADGKILLGGDFTSVGGITRNSIARVAADGSLDVGFNSTFRDRDIVYGVMLQPDGKILLTGVLSRVWGGFASIVRLYNDPATQALSAVDRTQVLWTRGGSAPEVTQTTFELSTDGGSSFSLLGGTATRGRNTAHWKLAGLNLPASGLLRARARTVGGRSNGSSGQIEQVVSFSGIQAPGCSVTQITPTLGSSLGGTTVTITGTNFTGATSVTFGGIPASFTVDSTTQITTTTPAHVAETVDVVITTPTGFGTGTLLYAYVQPPTTIKNQTLAFTPPARLFLSESPLILDTSSSSGLPVTLAVVSGPASLSRNVLRLTGPGTVKVRASQPGDIGFLAAVPVERTITVAANPTTLTLANLSQTYNGTPRSISVLGAAGTVNVTYKWGSSYVSFEPTNAGSYAVKAVAGAITKTGTLVITKAPLFVSPFDQRKFAGQPNPALGLAYSGFVGRDNAANSVSKAPAISTTATAASTGGLYPITTSGGSSTNYLFIHQKGTMKVETFAGSYEALLAPEAGQRPSAKLELTVAASSKTFTAKLSTPKETSALSLSGTLTTNTANETATGTATVKRGVNTYLVEVTLPFKADFTAEAKQNAVSLGKTTKGKRLLTLTKGQTLSYIGTHSALLAPATTSADVPAGAGWAVATIDAKGLLKLTGKLADGTGLTASLAADESSNPGYRLFLQPYTPARTETFLAGDFELKQHPDHTGRRFVAFEDVADLTWVKAPRLQDASYRAGFGFVDTRFTLDPWLPPAPAKGIVPAITLAQRLGLSGSANQFTVQHSSISSTSFGDLPTTLSLNATTNAVSVSAPVTTPANATKWKVTVTPATGAFVGSFELLDGGKRRIVPFAGMMRQPLIGDLNDLIGDGNFQLPSLFAAPNNELLSGEVGFER
jgi:uncharacterized delta-60 repeat protein